MNRTLAVCTALAAMLALPPGAMAKEVEKASVCGPDGCATTSNQKERQAIATAVENGGPPSTPPSRHAPYYRVRVFIKGMPRSEPPFRLLVAPAIRRVRGPEGTWFAMDRFAFRAWRRVTDGLRPFPGSRLPDVDPSAPRPVVAGQLPPRTYAPAVAHPAAGTTDETDWGLIAASVLASPLLLAALIYADRRRRGRPRRARRGGPLPGHPMDLS